MCVVRPKNSKQFIALFEYLCKYFHEVQNIDFSRGIDTAHPKTQDAIG